MDFLFYFWAIFAIWYELWSLSKQNYDQVVVLMDKLEKLDNKEFAKQATPRQSLFTLLSIGYFLWCLVGVFSSQWIMFLAILGLSILHYVFKKSYEWNIVDSILTLSILFFIILNQYHFHIPVGQKILEWFS